MQRFFLSERFSEKFRLDDDKIVHQIVSVLRSKTGDVFVFFNGNGTEYSYRLDAIGKKALEFVLVTEASSVSDPAKSLRLVQSMPNRWEKVEFILQKGVEVGISSFVFVRSDRSQSLPLTPNKIDRMMSVAKEALEQSGGNAFPEIDFSDGRLSAYLESADPDASIVLDTVEWSMLAEGLAISPADSNALMYRDTVFVWPEGGWSDAEREAFRAKKIPAVSFGKRVLRTETAGIFGAGWIVALSEAS